MVGYFIDEASYVRDPFCPAPKWSISNLPFPNRVPGVDYCVKIFSTDPLGGRILVIRTFYFKFWLFEINFGRIVMNFIDF